MSDEEYYELLVEARDWVDQKYPRGPRQMKMILHMYSTDYDRFDLCWYRHHDILNDLDKEFGEFQDEI